ncbi:MAG: hypothetical protein ACK5NT_02815 [Pyrinomonadaceae bacterium]
MDVYHKILLKVYEATGGLDSRRVDFPDLLKKEGFLPSLRDIQRQMSTSGWISDGDRPNTIFITHWGIMEAKKMLAGGGSRDTKEIDKRLAALKNAVKQLMVSCEELDSNSKTEDLKLINENLDHVSGLLKKLPDVL